MNKTDKIVVSIILIFAIVIGLILPIKSMASYGDENNPTVQIENYNPELEANSNIQTKIAYGKILQSNGNLWEVTSDMKAKKIDTKVSNCYFYEGQVDNILLGNGILYEDNTLKIEGKFVDKDTSEVIKTNNKTIKNVKKMLFNDRGHFNYVDSNNNIYQIDCFGEISEPILIASNVNKCWDYFYTKDGCTYRLDYEGKNPTKVLDEEIYDADRINWIANSNKCLCYYNTNNNQLTEVDSSFNRFADVEWSSGVAYYNNSDEIKQPIYNIQYNEETQQYDSTYVPSTPKYLRYVYGNGFRYVLFFNGILRCETSTNNYEQLTNVVDVTKINGIYVAVRSDGTVWGSEGGESAEFKKILGNSSINEHTHTWDNGKITKAATCTSTGIKTYTCTGCSETKTETIAKLAHSYKTTTTKATLSKDGSIVEKCSVCGNVKSSTPIYYPKTISLSKTSFTYNKKVQKPTVTVKDSKGKVIAASNYTVTYSNKDSKKVGRYSVTIKFKGNYEGTKTLTYDIKPKGVSIKKLTKGSKQIKATWGKNTTETTGYELQYATNSKFTTGKKTVNIKKNKTTSTTVKKIKGNKKYYVRIRTYKTVKFNGKSIKIYSGWSKVKNVTTKK